MPSLFLRPVMPSGAEGLALQLDWLLLQKDTVIDRGRAALHELSQLGAQSSWPEQPSDIALVVPAEEVLLLQANVPGRSTTAMRKALPYALEEFIASDLERVHIAHGPIRSGQGVHCAVMEAERLNHWIETLGEQGIKIGHLVSNAQLLADQEGTCALLFEESQVVVATADQGGSVPREALVDTLNLLTFKRLLLIGDHLTPMEIGLLEAAPEIDTEDQTPFVYLASRFTTVQPINLLQGAFAVQDARRPVEEALTGIAGLAALWFVIASLAMAVEGAWSSRQAEQLQAANVNHYKRLFPSDSVPITTAQLQRRFQAKLSGAAREAQSSQGFIDLLSRVATSLTSGHQVQSLRFNEDRMVLDVEVLIDTFDELDSIKSRSQGQGILLEASDASGEGNGVRARLRGSYQ